MSIVKNLNDINFKNFFDNGDVSVAPSVSTGLTKTCYTFIPANTFKAGDIINITTAFSNTSNSSSWDVYLYWNTGNTLTGATQLSKRTGIGSTQGYCQHSRTLHIITANGTGTGTYGLNLNPNPSNEYSDVSAPSPLFPNVVGSLVLDWTLDSYVFGALQSTTGQSLRNSYLKITTF